MTWYIGLAVGAGAAVLRVLVGWLKSGEPWEGWKAGRTLLIGVIEGGLIGVFTDLGVKEAFAGVFLGTVAVEDVLTGLGRLSKK